MTLERGAGDTLWAWAKKLFKVIDAKDATGFAGYFQPRGRFVFPRFPVVEGPEAIRDFVDHFFSLIQALTHTVYSVVEVDGKIYIEFEVRYLLHDTSEVVISGLETIEMEDGQVTDYIIYMDPQPLLEKLS